MLTLPSQTIWISSRIHRQPVLRLCGFTATGLQYRATESISLQEEILLCRVKILIPPLGLSILSCELTESNSQDRRSDLAKGFCRNSGACRPRHCSHPNWLRFSLYIGKLSFRHVSSRTMYFNSSRDLYRSCDSRNFNYLVVSYQTRKPRFFGGKTSNRRLSGQARQV